MTAVVILNIVFAGLVVGGIVALLGRAILADSPGARLSRKKLRHERRTRERGQLVATNARREALAARR
jgi:hypothetical protein